MNIIKYPKEMLDKVTGEAIDKSVVGADPEWRNVALKCLETVAENFSEFTVDEVRKHVVASGLITHDNRAMGGIIKSGVAQKWIEPTGRTIPSLVGHKIPMQIWRSKIYKPNLFNQ